MSLTLFVLSVKQNWLLTITLQIQFNSCELWYRERTSNFSMKLELTFYLWSSCVHDSLLTVHLIRLDHTSQHNLQTMNKSSRQNTLYDTYTVWRGRLLRCVHTLITYRRRVHEDRAVKKHTRRYKFRRFDVMFSLVFHLCLSLISDVSPKIKIKTE